MLFGAPPWWLLLPGPLLLVAELILLVAPVLAAGLVPCLLASAATRSAGTRVASVGHLITGTRPVGTGAGRRTVTTRDLPRGLATPKARLAAAWVSFALGSTVLAVAVAGTVWIVRAILAGPGGPA